MDNPSRIFLVLDAQTLAFANIRSEGTVENLRRRPDLEVDFIDVFARTGCRVRGRARYTLLDHAEADLLSKFKVKWPDLYNLIQGVVVIDVTEAQSLSSPSYDVGAVAGELTEHWLRHYANAFGFAVTKRIV